MVDSDFSYNPIASSIITGLLGIAFIVLKLTHVIDWSWWLVTLPFWGGVALLVVILLILIIISYFTRKKVHK